MTQMASGIFFSSSNVPIDFQAQFDHGAPVVGLVTWSTGVLRSCQYVGGRPHGWIVHRRPSGEMKRVTYHHGSEQSESHGLVFIEK